MTVSALQNTTDIELIYPAGDPDRMSVFLTHHPSFLKYLMRQKLNKGKKISSLKKSFLKIIKKVTSGVNQNVQILDVSDYDCVCFVTQMA